MKIENSSTVLSNIKLSKDSPGLKPELPPAAQEPGSQNAPETDKAPKASAKQTATGIRETEVEARKLKQEQVDAESRQAVEEQVANAIENIRGFIQKNQRSLDFDVAEESNRIIISVIDRSTNEVIRQIPPEEALELSDRIKRGDDITKSGLLVTGKA